MHYGKKVFSATIKVPFHASQKNAKRIYLNRRTGRQFVGTTSRVSKAKDFLLSELSSRARDAGLAHPFTGRLSAVLLFGFPPKKFYTRDKLTKQLRESKTLGDCSNLAQAIEDALQRANIIENDFQLAPIFVDRVCTNDIQVTIELYQCEIERGPNTGPSDE